MCRRAIDDPEISLNEIIRRWPETVPVFFRHKMRCVACLISPFHTVTDACLEYGLNEASFRAELRAETNGERLPQARQDREGDKPQSSCVCFLPTRTSPKR